MWICGQKGVFLFHIFFLLCTLHNFDKKVWTGGPIMKIMKKKSISFILLLESANLWTSSCHSILFLLSTIQNFDQKMWTDEKKWKFLKKIVLTSCIFLFANVDMWTKRCLSTTCFLSVMYSSQFWQKSVDRWTSNENYEKKL